MNVFGYLRVSAKSQIDGDGFPRQAQAIESFCSVQKLNLFKSYREKGVSGAVEGFDRPAFAELISDIDAWQRTKGIPVSAVVVERMDRLARDLMVYEVLLTELRKRNIQVFSTDQGQLIDMASNDVDPTRILIRQIMGALAQWEKTMIVRKLRAAKDRKKEAGFFVEGNKPYGALPGERHFLDFILAQFEHMNYSQIAKLLNSGDARQRDGKPWTPQNVRTVIINNKKV